MFAAFGFLYAGQAQAHNGEIGNYISCDASVSSTTTAKGKPAVLFGSPTQGIDLLQGQVADVQTTISYSCHNPRPQTVHVRLCLNINGGTANPSNYAPRLLTHTAASSNRLQFQLYKPDGTVWGSNAPGSTGTPFMTDMMILRPNTTATGNVVLTARVSNNQETVKAFADGSPYEADFSETSATLNWNATFWNNNPTNCGAFYSSNKSFPFVVQAHVAPSCQIVSAKDIDFGTHTTNNDTDLQESADLTVRCTNGTPYSIGLVPSNGNQFGLGEMKSVNNAAANTDRIPYQLRQTGNRNARFWGNHDSGSGSAKTNQTGTGNDQVHTVYATIRGIDYTPDEYRDKVTIHVKY